MIKWLVAIAAAFLMTGCTTGAGQPPATRRLQSGNVTVGAEMTWREVAITSFMIAACFRSLQCQGSNNVELFDGCVDNLTNKACRGFDCSKRIALLQPDWTECLASIETRDCSYAMSFHVLPRQCASVEGTVFGDILPRT